VAKESGFYITDDIQTAFVVVGDAGYSKVILNFGEYVIKTLDAKFFPETVVMAEPPAIRGSSLIILPETALETVPDEPGMFLLPITSIPEVGKVYTVNYNGAPYDCTLVDLGEFDPGVSVYAMGNFTATFPEGEMPEEIAAVNNQDAPFLIGISVSGGQLLESPVIIALDESTTVTLSISCGSSPVSMQLVTDINGTPIWEERTHWDNLSIIVPKGDYPGDLNGTYITTLPIHPIEEGRVYTVEMEGFVFETTFTKIYSEDYGLSYISEEYRDEENRWCQISLFPDNSISGFYGHILSSGFGGTGTPTFESANDGSYTQNIYIHAGSIKTLDPKYLAAAPNKSKTTILPKTTLTVSDPNDPGDGAQITTPFAEYPSAGDIWNITYNGIEYACEFIDASITSDTELPFPEGALYVGGNLTAAGFEHAASNNDAPFFIMAVGSEEFAVEMEGYGAIMPIVTLDQTFTVSITKGSQAPSQLTLRSNGEMVWEERPFYEEKSEVVILPLSNCVADSEEGGDDDGDGLVDTYVIEGSLLNYPTIGAKGTITVNGVEYESEFVDCSPIFGDNMPENFSVVACGNVATLGLTGGNSDAPFTCLLANNDSTAELMTGGIYTFEGELEGQDIITIEIKAIETKIKKLDSKFVDVEMPYYLPSSVPTENTLILP
jgi:hypothetical protein